MNRRRHVVMAAALGLVLIGASACSSGTMSNSATLSATPSASNGALSAAIADLPPEIVASGKLTFGTDPVLPPGVFTDKDGHLIGWELELAQLVAQRLGLTASFSDELFGDLLPAVAQGKTDTAVSSIFDTTEREKDVDLVDYYYGGTQWATLKDSHVGPDTACGAIVAAIKDSYQATVDLPARSDECVKAGRKAISVSTFTTERDMAEAVYTGKAAALLADSPAIGYATQRSRDRLIPIGDVYDLYYYGMPVKKGRTTLAKAIETALTSLYDDGTLSRLLGKWGVESGEVSTFPMNRAGG